MIVVNPNLIIEVMNEVIELFLKPKFNELNMNASGQWLETLESRVNINNGEIWGQDYTEFLVNGRHPGKRPPIAPIENWVQNKLGYSGVQARSIAFAVATKIAKEGTDYYPDGTDLLSILQTPEVTDYVSKRIGENILQQTIQQINDYSNRL